MSVRNHPTTRWFIEFCLVLSLVMQVPRALAGVIVEPNVHWIGPDAECDYPSIQEALDDIFSCGIFLCPPGTDELRLSANYNHAGQVLVRRTFDIRGGYPACKATFNGVNKTLSATTPGIPLFVIRPGSGTVRNVFRDLTLFGSSTQAPAGGVINMEAGNATLTLQDSNVTQGTAVSGGGIALAGGGNRLEIIDSEIAQNEAVEGGGIFCTNGGVVDFRSGEIRDNIAELSGGGVYLQGNCKLLGQTSGADRQILRNTVTDSQRGRGAGVFATFSTIEVGAINSRTRIGQNIVATQPLHDYDVPGDNRGGGVHLESADAVFYNSWFRGNEAADGGAIFAAGGSTLLVDRYSGPCHSSDTGNSPDCSLLEFNHARGGTDSDGDEGGDGAAFASATSLGQRPHVAIRRSVLRSNRASCFEGDEEDLTGECDLVNVLVAGLSETSIVNARGSNSEIVGNLVYGNNVGDHDNCVLDGCYKEGAYFAYVDVFNENTVAANDDADAVFDYSEPELINNVIWDFAPGDALDTPSRRIAISSCNVSNFADEFDDSADSLPVRSLDEDPLFINPDPGASPNEDFRVQVPDSPAVDRCDDQDGRLTLSYDIVGHPRPVNIPGTSNGPGERDAGAFEAVPVGAVNNGTDLIVTIESDSPKQAELSEPHAFTIDVTNTGRNSPFPFSVVFNFSPNGVIESLLAPNDPISNQPRWSCSVASARCDSLGGLAPGGTTLPITLTVSYFFSGLKTVTANVLMEDPALTELTPENNVASDTVTVGPGADLSIDVFTEFPREVALGEPHRFFVTVGNNGPEMVAGANVLLDVGGGQIDSFDAPEWSCNTTTAICARSTPLDPGPGLSFIDADIRYDQPGQKTLIATVAATDGTGDPNPFNNSDEDFVDVVGSEELFADGFEN